jgi:hypothetical protein
VKIKRFNIGESAETKAKEILLKWFDDRIIIEEYGVPSSRGIIPVSPSIKQKSRFWKKPNLLIRRKSDNKIICLIEPERRSFAAWKKIREDKTVWINVHKLNPEYGWLFHSRSLNVPGFYMIFWSNLKSFLFADFESLWLHRLQERENKVEKISGHGKERNYPVPLEIFLGPEELKKKIEELIEK